MVVRDRSMLPTLAPGDRLLVDVGAYRRSVPRPGEVVVLLDPEDRRRWLIKRVAAVAGDALPGPRVPGDDARVPAGRVYVLADDRRAGRDSRSFGPVPMTSIVGRAWFRTAPAARAGPVPP